MTALSAAVFILLLGTAACLLPLRKTTHAGIGILSQVLAAGLIWAVAIPILAGRAPVVGELAWAYQHRGVEDLLLRRPPLALTPLVESIAGDSSIAYAWSYCAAVEALSGAEASSESDVVRGIALELERVAMHLASPTGMATDIAFLHGGATYGRLRTAIINACMRACGSRFGRGWLRPGGVRSRPPGNHLTFCQGLCRGQRPGAQRTQRPFPASGHGFQRGAR